MSIIPDPLRLYLFSLTNIPASLAKVAGLQEM
jgi:hypothetical protein